MIDITENTIGTWYVQVTPTSDFMAALSRNPTDNTYELNGRFRYYKDDKAFDSADEKHWFKAKYAGDADPLKELQGIIQNMAKMAGAEVFEILMKDGDVKAFADELMNSHWAHHKKEWRN